MRIQARLANVTGAPPPAGRVSTVPDALIVGPMKAGTTWVYDYLATRGDVCLPRGVKETFFFDRRFHYGSEWYSSHFRQWEEAAYLRTVEVAPSYFPSVDAPQRIRSLLGAVPIVVILRDPVARSWSHYLHLRRKGYTRLKLPDATRRFPEILDASRYTQVLPRWLDQFGPESVRVLLYRELAADAESFAAKLCAALDLRFEGLPLNRVGRSNEAGVAPSILLAAIGRTVADTLRSRRMYSVVNAAKRLGLKNVFFGRGTSNAPRLGPEDRDWLEAQLLPQLEGLHALLGAEVTW
jgi:hypothetical protein